MMSCTPSTATFWGHKLQQNLAGSFTARSSGFFASELSLLTLGVEEFGTLRLGRMGDAQFQAESFVAAFETSGKRYSMGVDGREILAAHSKGYSTDKLEIFCGDQTYEAQISPFRNLALASQPAGEKTAHLSGGLTGRSYEVLFAAEDRCALSVAVFLLWRIVAARRHAYRAGGAM
ncbi:MAG: hypothetical protein JOZ19_10340 [Rubrobacter sp.]|nr:hypothetical protein [Rubrobacter sp.]